MRREPRVCRREANLHEGARGDAELVPRGLLDRLNPERLLAGCSLNSPLLSRTGTDPSSTVFPTPTRRSGNEEEERKKRGEGGLSLYKGSRSRVRGNGNGCVTPTRGRRRRRDARERWGPKKRAPIVPRSCGVARRKPRAADEAIVDGEAIAYKGTAGERGRSAVSRD